MDRLSKYRRTIRPRHSSAKSPNKPHIAATSADSGLPQTSITATSLTTASTGPSQQQQQPRGANNVIGGIGAQIYQHEETKLRSCANWVNSLPLVYSPIMSPTAAPRSTTNQQLRSGPSTYNSPPNAPMTVAANIALPITRKRKADRVCEGVDQPPHQQARRQRRNNEQPSTSEAAATGQYNRSPELPIGTIDQLASTVSTAISSLTNQTVATLPPAPTAQDKSPTVNKKDRLSPIKEIFKRVRFAVRSGGPSKKKVVKPPLEVPSNAISAKVDTAQALPNVQASSALKRVRFSLRRKAKDQIHDKRRAEEDFSFESKEQTDRRYVEYVHGFVYVVYNRLLHHWQINTTAKAANR